MSNFTFADRYSEAGIAPGAQTIAARQEPARRIVDEITDAQTLELVEAYYGSTGLDLSWLRDEFIKEDASFSLVNNEREAQLLAALILGELVEAENNVAILAIITGNVMGLRVPKMAPWLLVNAKEAHGLLAVAGRKPTTVKRISPKSSPKIEEDIAAISQNDWATLLEVLGKIRTEANEAVKNVTAQSTAALITLDRNVKLVKEESQMLWWLFGGHSRSLERSFDTFNPLQAALVGAIDLGNLTTESGLGPVAAQAILERVIALSKRPKGTQPRDLAAAVDGISAEDLAQLTVFSEVLPPKLSPVTLAIAMAQTMGTGTWHMQFKSRTGLDASMTVEPTFLAEQLYREYLLGRLL